MVSIISIPETVPPTAETAEDVAGEFLSRKFGEDKNKIFFDNGILPCGDGFFAICRIDGMNYAIYTDGKSFVKPVKLEHEHAVMQENYSDNGALLTANGLTVTMTDMKIGEKLVIDFDKETYEHFFCPTEESLDYEFGTSADKKYTLWKLHPVGRGDISRYRLALQNNGTGEIRVIEKAGIRGGIYGGYGGAGFFQNGEIYVYSTDWMIVFDPETLEMTFDMSENFPIGRGGGYRKLLCFRRDPVNFSYVVIYMNADNDTVELSDTKYEGIYEGNNSYQIGFLDKDGNLLESYDMGMGVLSTDFNFADVSMRFADDTITLFAQGNKPNDLYKIGVFDRKTHEFTESFEKV